MPIHKGLTRSRDVAGGVSAWCELSRGVAGHLRQVVPGRAGGQLSLAQRCASALPSARTMTLATVGTWSGLRRLHGTKRTFTRWGDGEPSKELSAGAAGHRCCRILTAVRQSRIGRAALLGFGQRGIDRPFVEVPTDRAVSDLHGRRRSTSALACEGAAARVRPAISAPGRPIHQPARGRLTISLGLGAPLAGGSVLRVARADSR